MPKQSIEPQGYEEGERPQIALQPVESSQIDRIGYDAETMTLAVQFKHGARAIYHYPGVRPDTHAEFMAAESKGNFFKERIKPLLFKKYRPDAQPA